MAYTFNREQSFSSPQFGSNATKSDKVNEQRTLPVRYSAAVITATYIKPQSPVTSFTTDSAALLAALLAVDGLDVIEWPRDNEVTINGGQKMHEQAAWEIFYRGKHIMIRLLTEDPAVDTTEYRILSEVVKEGYIDQCRCVNVWARWFNDQFNYTMVTPLFRSNNGS